MRILVVDDEKTFCLLLVEVLASQGHQVDWANHTLEAYKKAQRHYYDLFVVDVHMPIILGTQLANVLREQSPAAKIILISAFADNTLHDAAHKLGAPLLSKPFTVETLLAVVAQTVHR